LVLNHPAELVEKASLLGGEVLTVEEFAEMPVGGVEKAHVERREV
jgi:hypothetical protein